MKAVGIGELVWDLLPNGPRLGGAPFNVIANLARLGWESLYFSAVGNDELGARTLEGMRRLNVSTRFVRTVDVPTGIVRVQLDRDGVPEYEIVSPAAYEELAPVEPPSAIGVFDALVFGTLAQRPPGTLATTRGLAAAQPDAVRLYDLNLRHSCWSIKLVERLLGLATVVKLSEAEATILAEELALPRDSLAMFSLALAARFDLRGVCVTRGADGATLLCDGRSGEAKAVRVDVVDTVGAGDAFAAGLAFGISAGWDVERVLELGSHLASLVASRDGAIPDWDVSELGLDISRTSASPRAVVGRGAALDHLSSG
jgi:fructokinase